MQKRINIAGSHQNKLMSEFGVSMQTVYNALRYFTQSELAQDIRKRAKELLIEEAERIVIQ